jgi:hypothetical protein
MVCIPARDAKNPAPGVCVDIRSEAAPGAEGSEFFLNPSPCKMSTCKPVRYIIVENKRADELENFPEHAPIRISDFKQFTYAMCWCALATSPGLDNSFSRYQLNCMFCHRSGCTRTGQPPSRYPS